MTEMTTEKDVQVLDKIPVLNVADMAIQDGIEVEEPEQDEDEEEGE